MKKLNTIAKKIVGLFGHTGYKAFEVKVVGGEDELFCMFHNFSYDQKYERSKQKVEGSKHRVTGKAVICANGFHFCKNFRSISNYYNFSFSSNQRYAKVVGWGSTDFESDKMCATNLKIVKLLTNQEVFDLQFRKEIYFYNFFSSLSVNIRREIYDNSEIRFGSAVQINIYDINNNPIYDLDYCSHYKFERLSTTFVSKQHEQANDMFDQTIEPVNYKVVKITKIEYLLGKLNQLVAW